MKKIIIILLAIGFILPAFAVCSEAADSKKAAPAKPELKVEQQLEKLRMDYKALLAEHQKVLQLYYREKQQRLRAESEAFVCDVAKSNEALQKFRSKLEGKKEKEKKDVKNK